MHDVFDLLRFLATVLIPIVVVIVLVEALLRTKGLLRTMQWVQERFDAALVEQRIRKAEKRWLTGFTSKPLAGLSPEESRALFLHDVELGTGKGLLVTYEGDVYVSPRHHKQIERYLRRSGSEAATQMFAKHGYRLFTAKSR